MTNRAEAWVTEPLHQGDLDTLDALYDAVRQGMAAAGKALWLGPTPRARLAEALAPRPGGVWGAAGATLGVRCARGLLVGACSVRLEVAGVARQLVERSPVNVPHLALTRSLVVATEARGHGLGEHLLRAVGALARRRGYVALATLDARNTRSRIALQRAGGLLVARGPTEYDADADELLFALGGPADLGLRLRGPRIHLPSDAPIERWGRLLDQGLVGQLQGGRLCFSVAWPVAEAPGQVA